MEMLVKRYPGEQYGLEAIVQYLGPIYTKKEDL